METPGLGCAYLRSVCWHSRERDTMDPDLRDAYLQICDRSLRAADASKAARVHEKSCFLSYHALESLGGAFAASRGHSYPRGHQGKMNCFVSLVRPTKHARSTAALAIMLSSLRNRALYPSADGRGAIRGPSVAVTEASVRDIPKRVRGLAARLRRLM